MAQDQATFAGGCFWCIESAFEGVPGVTEAVSGYTGGTVAHPTYEQVSTGRTGHVEAVRVTFDPAVIPYEELLSIFWRQMDPTDDGGQFADRGSQYRPAVFYHSPDQKRKAERSREDLARSGRFSQTVVTEILPAGEFYPAEGEHQNYSKNNPDHYQRYKTGSGRAGFLDKHWKKQACNLPTPSRQAVAKPSDAELKSRLTDLQFQVTQCGGTEPPFRNEYWDNHRPGLYMDILSGEPLFSSTDKFDSGTGWPSFVRPIEHDAVVEKTDESLGMRRTEVVSRQGQSHLGHVFDDGPAPTGRRYCINSAALRFVPKDELESAGHGRFLPLFK